MSKLFEGLKKGLEEALAEVEERFNLTRVILIPGNGITEQLMPIMFTPPS